MDSDYPGSIDTFRENVNIPGIEYDSSKERVIYAEDLNKLRSAVLAIEETLGADLENVADVFYSLRSSLMPVGFIYSSTSSTNPGTSLGFGTWTAFGAGRVLVGKASSGTFSTAGATGGAETHTLSTTEIPSHKHQLRMKSDGGLVANSLPSYVSGATWDFDSTISGPTAFGGTGTGDHQSQATGGGGAHNNIQPFIVVYMWERTA